MPLKTTDMTTDQLHILLAVQDPNFYSHPGADFSLSGGVWTTITEGMVKQFYFRHFHPGFLHLGKMRQVFLAIGFNRRVPKDEQLRVFINRAYLGSCNGHSVYGFDDAAHSYFGQSFTSLSREEYISLVAALASPATLNPMTHHQENQHRVARIDRLLRGVCKRLGNSDALLEDCAK